MRVLIIGGSGLLGSELVRRSLAAGHEIVATYLTRPGEVDGIVWRPLDIRRHVAGADAISRYELGLLIARRDGLDSSALPRGRRAGTGIPGPLDVRLDSAATQRRLRTTLRGARRFLRPGDSPTAPPETGPAKNR